MPVRLITPPASEPITLAEAKAHLRLEGALDDTTVSTLILAARQYVEQIAWRGLVTQTLELVLKEFPAAESIKLSGGNLVSITSVKYLDLGGVEQTLAATEYEPDTLLVPGRLRLKYGKSWPATLDRWNAVAVQYVVGWPQAAVPAPIKQALLLLVSQMYEHRTPEVTGATISQVQFAFDALISSYRLVEL